MKLALFNLKGLSQMFVAVSSIDNTIHIPIWAWPLSMAKAIKNDNTISFNK
jgi:hypothetical protein